LCVIFISSSIQVQFIADCDGVDTVETIGFAARARNAQESPDWNFAIYVVETLGILLAPTLFAASIYMELGRIILLTDGDVYSVVKRRWMTAFFVTGDVFSFIVQAIGIIFLLNKPLSDFLVETTNKSFT
jgi:hypothetical protein